MVQGENNGDIAKHLLNFSLGENGLTLGTGEGSQGRYVDPIKGNKTVDIPAFSLEDFESDLPAFTDMSRDGDRRDGGQDRGTGWTDRFEAWCLWALEDRGGASSSSDARRV